MAPDLENGTSERNGSWSPQEVEAPMATHTPAVGSGAPINEEKLNSVMQSEIGIGVLLSRLKQSIASAREFSSFLSKRAKLEEKHAQGLKEISKSMVESLRRPDGRQGSFGLHMADVTRAHDRMADHGMYFANSLQKMHEDLNDLTGNMDRQRKHWKQEGANSEKRAKDAEIAMDKAKTRYDTLAEDYDRARTGDKSSGRVFTVKGPKSAEKHEEDLNRKLQASDSDYQSKVKSAQNLREDNINKLRPQAVKAVKELIRECDSALVLQLQKFAAFNEKLLVGNGLEVSPVKDPAGGDTSRPSSMREMIQQIDNERDFHTYVMGHTGSVPPRPVDIKYVPHHTLAPTQQAPAQSSYNNTSSAPQIQPPQTSSQGPTLTIANPSSPATTSQPQTSYLSQTSAGLQSPSQQYSSPASTSSPYGTYQQGRQPTPDRSFRGTPSSSQPPYPSQTINEQFSSTLFSPTSATNGYSSNTAEMPAVTDPVFGISLEALFRRDEMAVPMVVMQCIQAVDLFGLEIEGIYRLSGNSNHISHLKSVFNNDASRVDFRNPESFYHDVNSVAGLLKQFFRELPDPLFTKEHYQAFIDAAKIEEETARRDSVHSVINALPDPNYATLRALVLHLYRVQEHSQANRMSTANLAICFAPTLMGQHSGPHMADAGLQARVIDTILGNTYSIFDED